MFRSPLDKFCNILESITSWQYPFLRNQSVVLYRLFLQYFDWCFRNDPVYILVNHSNQPRIVLTHCFPEVLHILVVFQYHLCIFQRILIILSHITSTYPSKVLPNSLQELGSTQLIGQLPIHYLWLSFIIVHIQHSLMVLANH